MSLLPDILAHPWIMNFCATKSHIHSRLSEWRKALRAVEAAERRLIAADTERPPIAIKGRTAKVRSSFSHMPKAFCVDDIEEWLEAHGVSVPRTEINFILNHAVRRGEITLVQKGRAWNPSTFKLSTPPST